MLAATASRISRRPGARSIAIALALLVPGTSLALDRSAERLASPDAVRAACRDAELEGPRTLYTVDLEPGTWRFEALTDDGFLAIDTRRNLPVFGGSVELLPNGLEPVGLWTEPERADRLVAASRRGGRLRLGFFLGFDNHHGTVCLVRSVYAVTTVRMDVAFVELQTADGELVARDNHERLRAWLDDVERDGVPGSGPRGAFGRATLAQGPGTLPSGWQSALERANTTGGAAGAFGACHRDGLARGATPDGRVVLRVDVDASSGRVLRSDVELSSVGDEEEASCIAAAVPGAVRFPAAPGGRIQMSLPIVLAD